MDEYSLRLTELFPFFNIVAIIKQIKPDPALTTPLQTQNPDPFLLPNLNNQNGMKQYGDFGENTFLQK